MDKWIHSPPLAPPPAPAPRVLLYLAPGALPLRRGRRRGQRHQLPWRRLRELRRAVLHVVIQVPVVGVAVKQAADALIESDTFRKLQMVKQATDGLLPSHTFRKLFAVKQATDG